MKRRRRRPTAVRLAVRAALGLLMLLLTFYALLAADLLGGMPASLIGTLSSRDGNTVTIHGLRTDLFWNTSVDSVVITSPEGLKVLVAEASVRGGVLDYMFAGKVDEIRVERLDIALAPAEADTAEAQSLKMILENIDLSIPLGARECTLVYGRITDGPVTVVDSMQLSAAVHRSIGVDLDISHAGVVLPGFGRIEAHGDLSLAGCQVSSNGLEVSAPPGSVSVSGSMNGPDCTIDFSLRGFAGTAFTGLPVDISTTFEGRVHGPMSSPIADLTFQDGRATLFGRDATIHADTIRADIEGVMIRGLALACSTATLDVDADLTTVDMSWNASLVLSLDGTDLTHCWGRLPEGIVSGSLEISGYGTGDSAVTGDVSARIHGSSIAGVSIQSLNISAGISAGDFRATGNASVEDDEIGISLDGTLGAGFALETISARVTTELGSNALAGKLGIYGIPGFTSAVADISVSASGFQDGQVPSSWDLEGDLELRSLSDLSMLGVEGVTGLGRTRLAVAAQGVSENGLPMPTSAEMHLVTTTPAFSPSRLLAAPGIPDVHGLTVSLDATARLFGPDMVPGSWTASITAGAASLNGPDMFGLAGLDHVDGLSLALSGSGTRFAITARGSAGVDSVSLGTVSIESLAVQGSIDMALGRLRANGDLLVDSLHLDGDAFRVEAGFDFDGDHLEVDTLSLTGPDGSFYSTWLTVDLGTETRFAAGDILAARSKHRLITDGAFSGYASEGLIVLDTLWVHPPVGILGLSGFISDDSLRFQAEVDNFDLTSLRTLIGLPVEMSGVGTFTGLIERTGSDVSGSLTGAVQGPSYGPFSMDSLTVAVRADQDGVSIDGIYAWHDGVRSGLQMTASGTWTESGLELTDATIDWIELEVNDLGDWLFYVLPLPLRTMGASVSARAEYSRTEGEPSLQFQASARIERLFITILGVELPKVNFYFNYPDSSSEGYNARLTLGSGDADSGNLSSTWLMNIIGVDPFELGDYTITANMDNMEVPIPGIGAVIVSGNLGSSGSGLEARPLLSGHVDIIEGAVGIPNSTGTSQGGSAELPFDLSINITGTGGIWFRTSFADIEAAVKMKVITLERQPTVNGVVSAVRGRITLLQNDFEISEGRVELIQGIPPEINLNVTAVTRVRSLMDQQRYDLTVLITGTVDNPVVTLTGTGPIGPLSQEDILTLLAVGVTYGEMQQLNSAALRSEVENVAQSIVGSLLARNLRHEIGLDTFEITPELLSDTTSLVLNVGKYVLPSLYVSYKGDVFSPDPGTFSIQYFFSQDLSVEGTTRSTIHNDMEPTIELHYTIRY